MGTALKLFVVTFAYTGLMLYRQARMTPIPWPMLALCGVIAAALAANARIIASSLPTVGQRGQVAVATIGSAAIWLVASIILFTVAANLYGT